MNDGSSGTPGGEAGAGADPDARKAEALRLRALGRTVQSRQVLEAAFAEAPGRADLAYRLGLARLEAGDPAGANACYAAALALDPDRILMEREAIVPIDDLLSRRGTFHNARKVKKALLAGRAPKLKAPQVLRERSRD